MLRKEKTVKIDGEEFTVREVSVGDVMPLMPKFGGEEANQATMELMKKCIYRNGQPVGDGVSEFGLSLYMKLADHVIEINGLGAGKG